MLTRIAVAAILISLTSVCASGQTSTYAKSGFVAEVKDGRLWVFREGSPELEEFRKHGELTKMVSRIGGGPDGMTIRSGDAQVIDEYLAAK